MRRKRAEEESKKRRENQKKENNGSKKGSRGVKDLEWRRRSSEVRGKGQKIGFL